MEDLSEARKEAAFQAQGRRMLRTPGATMNFESERAPETIERDGPDLHLSADAMSFLGESMRQWAMSRIIRKHQATGEFTHKIELELTVKLNGEDAESGEVVRFTMPTINGSHRQDGAT